MGALAVGGDVDPQRALAAGLDDRVRGLHQDREVGLQQVGVALREQAEAVVLALDLLGLVEDEGHVAVGLGHGRRRAAAMTATPPFMSQVPRPCSSVAVAAARAGCR